MSDTPTETRRRASPAGEPSSVASDQGGPDRPRAVQLVARIHQQRHDDGEAVRIWVRDILRRNDWTPTDLARKSGVGQSNLSRFMNGQTASLSRRSIAQIAAAAESATSSVIDQNQLGYAVMPFSDVAKDGSIPVWGVHPLQRQRLFRFNPIAVTTIPRPSTIAPSRKLAAFFAIDESMAPRWRMGEPVIFDLSRPSMEGNHAVITLNDDSDADGSELYAFRRYLGRSDGNIRLQAYDTSGVETFPIERVLSVRQVLEWRDILPG